MSRLVALLVWTAVALPACTEKSASSRCQDVCRREAQCVEQAVDHSGAGPVAFDQSECVAACNTLENDSKGVELVVRQHECVRKATSCEDLMRDCR